MRLSSRGLDVAEHDNEHATSPHEIQLSEAATAVVSWMRDMQRTK